MAMNKITKGYPNWDVPYNENVDEYNNTIGNEELLTTSKTIKGAINEIHNVADDVTTINADISNLKKSVAQNTSSLNEKVNKSAIANNSSTTEEGYIADARQIKYLKDLITNISNLDGIASDLNNVSSIFTRYDGTTLNTPYSQGLLSAQIGICLSFLNGNLQIVLPYQTNGIYMRYGKGSWAKITN